MKQQTLLSRAQIRERLCDLSVADMNAVAVSTGVSLSTLYRMRRPESNPTLDHVEAVSAYFTKPVR